MSMIVNNLKDGDSSNFFRGPPVNLKEEKSKMKVWKYMLTKDNT